jgi:hypothetical protein
MLLAGSGPTVALDRHLSPLDQDLSSALVASLQLTELVDSSTAGLAVHHLTFGFGAAPYY